MQTPDSDTSIRRFGQWHFNPVDGSLKSSDHEQTLPPRLSKLLTILTDYPGEMVSRERIIEYVWANKVVNEDALSRCIAELRNVLKDDRQAPEFIETIPRRGYKFIKPLKGGIRLSKPRMSQLSVLLVVLVIVLTSVVRLLTPEPPDFRSAISNATRVTFDHAIEYQPEISNDGTLIAYASVVGSRYEVFIVDNAGRTRFTFADQDYHLLSPTLSPDNQQLLAAKTARGQCFVELFDLAANTRQQLFECEHPNGSGIFDWAPDQSAFLYVKSNAADDSSEIWHYEFASQVHRQISHSDDV